MSVESRIRAGLEHTAVWPEALTVHLSLDMYRELKREVNPALEHTHEVTHVDDVPVKVDLNMKPGEIVVRYEVKA